MKKEYEVIFVKSIYLPIRVEAEDAKLRTSPTACSTNGTSTCQSSTTSTCQTWKKSRLLKRHKEETA